MDRKKRLFNSLILSLLPGGGGGCELYKKTWFIWQRRGRVRDTKEETAAVFKPCSFGE